MIKPVSKTKPLFCEQYWQNIIKKTRLNEEHKTHVSGSLVYSVNNRLDTSGYDFIHDINKYFINGLPKKSIENLNVPLYQYIAQTDKEFKELAPTNEPMILWRGVSVPEKKARRYPRFEQAYNRKTGDIVYMPEYAYATDKKNIALVYTLLHARDNYPHNSIVYEIHVPKGSKISKSRHYIFPRSSRFECMDTQEIEENGYKYKLITVQYIQPEEIKIETNKKKLNFIGKITRFFQK